MQRLCQSFTAGVYCDCSTKVSEKKWGRRPQTHSLFIRKNLLCLITPHLHKEVVHLHSCRASSHHMRI